VDQDRRIAIKFAYDGTLFHGFQRQPNMITVEGELVKALTKVGAIKSMNECGYRSSSRTDTGVSALGNIISIRTPFEIDGLCSAVNSKMEGIWAYSAVEVADAFNPRAAKQRWYRYHLTKANQDLGLMHEIAERFVGVHDFSGHARKSKRNPMRKIDSIDLSDAGAFHAIDFRAESFLWNMIRRIVWMMNEGSRGRAPLDSLGPEPKRKPVRIGLARPEFLILMDIDCGIEFPSHPRATRSVATSINQRMVDASMKLAFAKELGRRLTGYKY
jgi:tRNA pseudouridine38-40 synthase